MRLRYYVMAAPIPSFYLNCHPVLKKIHQNPPLKISKFPLKPVETPSLREICKRGSVNEAFQSLTDLFANQSPSQFSLDEAYSSVLELCGSKKALSEGQQVHAHMITSNALFNSVFLSTRLVFMYGKCGCLVDAEKLFDGMPHKTIFTWNAMVGAYVTNGEPLGSLELYREMRVSGIPLDACTFPCILKACGLLKDRRCGAEVHGLAIKEGYVSIVFVANSIVGMYTKCNDLNGARQLFDRMPEKEDVKASLAPNTYTFVAALQTCEDSSFIKQALQFYHEMRDAGQKPDLVAVISIIAASARSGNTLHGMQIHAYAMKNGRCFLDNDHCWPCSDGSHSRALELFREVQLEGIDLDVMMISSILLACSGLKLISSVKEIHSYIIRKGLSDLVLQNGIVDVYGDMISCYVHNGLANEALEIFHLMKETGVEPDSISLVSILSAAASLSALKKGKEIHGFLIRKGFVLEGVSCEHACGHVCPLWNSGEIAAAIDLFRRMEDESIAPDHIAFVAVLYACSHSGLMNEEHYACLVDLLGRANHLEEAYQFVKGMEVEPTAELRSSLRWIQRIREITCWYQMCMLQNERWKDVEEVRMRMKASGLKKNPGCSWIEVGNKVHTFMARDKSHPQSYEIYSKLSQITEKLAKEGGYVAQTKFVLHNAKEEEKVQMLYGHSERLAIAYGMLTTPEGASLRITKNLRVCGDCHNFCKLISKFFERELVMRDANRFHHFKGGVCSCGDVW
ncbi:Pentatricopeptide repeat-containing protein, chloroplastic [Vitis vinifera]|uniref:Pentatricopeptide repeat-containing protein, chloroplastic n=1 Tax=Vitis vinifera TaxID=29760 RepID=A0A438KH24_VITVI|nr:Pentatricopeptide repeat-containing protein, chloroplastic [Vitis vinifera]